MVPVIGSFANVSTYVISALSNPLGIGSFCFTNFKLPLSLICNNKSTVFWPCSAKITPPCTGVVVKSYAVPENEERDPYPDLLAISAFTLFFKLIISAVVNM